MKLGESVVAENIKYQCLSLGSSVFYKETVRAHKILDLFRFVLDLWSDGTT